MKYSRGAAQAVTPQSTKSSSGASGSAGRQAGAARRLVIDARESGTSTGRYVDKLIEYLAKIGPDFEFSVLTKPARVDFLKSVAPDFEIIESPHKEFTLAEQTGLLKQLNAVGADLVHFAMPQQPLRYHGKTVTTIHDLTTTRFDNPAKNKFIFKTKQTLYRRLIKTVARKSDRLITPSKFVKADVAQYAHVSPDKIIVVHEAAEKIKLEPEAIAKLKDQKFIMYVGRPNPHKNLSRLVEAFGKVVQTHQGLKLVLAGEVDKNYHLLQRLVQDRNLTSQVLFLGRVNDGQLRWLYENTAAYVFPSLSEGFGLPGLEAMIHGAPVVSANATCLPEIYGDAAYYFDPLDINDMSAKISEVLDNFSLSTNLIARGKAQAAKYSWGKTAEQTFEVYKSVLT